MLFFNLLAVICVFGIFAIPALDSIKSNIRAAAAPRLTITESTMPVRDEWQEAWDAMTRETRAVARALVIQADRERAAISRASNPLPAPMPSEWQQAMEEEMQADLAWEREMDEWVKSFQMPYEVEIYEEEISCYEESPIGSVYDFSPVLSEVEVAIQNDLGLIRGKQELWVCWGRKVENISTVNFLNKSANNNKSYKKPPKLFERWG